MARLSVFAVRTWRRTPATFFRTNPTGLQRVPVVAPTFGGPGLPAPVGRMTWWRLPEAGWSPGADGI